MGNNICLVCTRYGRSQNLTSDFDLHLDTFHSLPTLIHQWWLGEVYGSIERNTYPGNKALKLVTCGQILFMGENTQFSGSTLCSPLKEDSIMMAG